MENMSKTWVNNLSERNIYRREINIKKAGKRWALWMTQWTEALMFVCTFVNFISSTSQ